MLHLISSRTFWASLLSLLSYKTLFHPFKITKSMNLFSNLYFLKLGIADFIIL